MMAIELLHMTRILTGSGEVKSLQSSGWENSEDEFNLSNQGGGSSIWDR